MPKLKPCILHFEDSSPCGCPPAISQRSRIEFSYLDCGSLNDLGHSQTYVLTERRIRQGDVVDWEIVSMAVHAV